MEVSTIINVWTETMENFTNNSMDYKLPNTPLTQEYPDYEKYLIMTIALCIFGFICLVYICWPFIIYCKNSCCQNSNCVIDTEIVEQSEKELTVYFNKNGKCPV